MNSMPLGFSINSAGLYSKVKSHRIRLLKFNLNNLFSHIFLFFIRWKEIEIKLAIQLMSVVFMENHQTFIHWKVYIKKCIRDHNL